MRSSANQKGFTLAEVMIAVTITSLIGTVIYGSFAQTFNAQELTSKIQERYHGVQVALERMSREISMAFVFDCRELQTPLGDRHQQSIFKVEHEGDVDRLTFQSFSHLRLFHDAHESDQNLLTYYGEDDPEDSSKTNLMRREKVRFFSNDSDEDGTAVVLCRDVKSLRFEFWDDTKQDWTSDWDCRQLERVNTLPRLVRIKMQVLDHQKRELSFSTIARIFVNKPLSNWIKPAQ